MQTLVHANNFSITRADTADLRACRMLLPATCSPTFAPEFLAAIDTNGQLIGAAAIGWASIAEPPAFPLDVHVLPAWRRRGVGRALVDAAGAFVQAEAAAVAPWSKLAEDTAAAAFCRAVGFTVHHRVLNFTADAPTLESALATYRAKLDRAGWIPSGARVVTLAEAPAAEVAHLVCREFGSSPAAMLARFTGHGDKPVEPDLSVVLLLDGTVAGAQIVSFAADGLPEVEANVVIPTLRRGWANLLLTHEGTQRSAAAGTRSFRFFCDERVIDTVNLARRCGAEPIRTDLVMTRPCVAA